MDATYPQKQDLRLHSYLCYQIQYHARLVAMYLTI